MIRVAIIEDDADDAAELKKNVEDVIGELGHQERLAHLGRSGKEVGAGAEQTVNDGRSALVDSFVKLPHGDGGQIRRVIHAPHLSEQFFHIFFGKFVVAILRLVCYTGVGT